MKRKVKEGYYCCVDYIPNISAPTTVCVKVICSNDKGQLNSMVTANSKSVKDAHIVDIRWYDPMNQSCSLESATEQIAPEVGTFWGNSYTVFKIVCDRKLECPEFNSKLYSRFNTVTKDGAYIGYDHLDQFIQVADWNGNKLPGS